ncbi:DUF3560 domain-containing protein [Mesorhizobium sp. M2A.F.Ca.ET.037.01.1.1]|nr:DUF3560 domain-containing protein [Mesorhizobium sp. M2A.F.Ca.ET.043.05.1.1]RUX23412.1 DUF3560 domain-containing protein [Mesorhizobium sp. M2A.F.Ca.ET.037.01.1.1]RUY13124.1 DUF3560 domain-containing protein [Mesorhizobium sp. M2A.F.Ca.ET.040.01.1.1]RWA89293.1 MAG: DUF3560 domain-containing protein [Mesorhizobium sp.]
MIISATYSPEDNKLRLYPSARLDAETYQRVKDAGFVWAPKQELFVAPKWSPAREDLAIELAGEIEPEEMTLVERAQAKAERLDELAIKRHRQANAFQRAAEDLSEAFAYGQPILVGHHSERKARKTQERMQAAMTNANKAQKLANYWLYRAEGVQLHANYKNDPRVRANRIKTLLADLRDMQREINHAYLTFAMWEKVTEDETIKVAIGRSIPTGQLAPWDLWGKVERGEVSPQEARQQCIDAAQRSLSSDRRRRYIEHTLNRLSYERELLGPVRRYEGELTPVILQAFAREHGAHKPQARAIDAKTFILESEATLPLHLANDTELSLSAEEWRDLMQSVGYEVPQERDALPPILNLNAKALRSRHRYHRDQIQTFPVVEMTKSKYAQFHLEQRGVRLSLCGDFRFRICINPKHEPRYLAPFVAVFFTDAKAHPAPHSVAVLENSDDTQ